MRELTAHIVDGDSSNHQLQINVIDEPGQGGACHHYEIEGFNSLSNPSKRDRFGVTVDAQIETILFQNGPIKEFGVNGITQEALLAIVIDRLECFQAGPYACHDNQVALQHCKLALDYLQNRTRERIKRNVEGTHQK